ncbi:ErfK/YbiS/YcfS/YnhG family protein [Planktothrix tepida]|uniref:ErfK/YbiS/YcfS/YnhG family protein n=2 Tax=Planktothrix TaxID=54304 RepID=A0A1J1LGE7_9CYAN|nr:ErfK/YbiS/YcfS/YnhG family protein [Planktothrix tepida]CAD5979043.1 ErfK/YbiS/YcfS/YnhG family protein [Planktothrix pseudagardhii]CUR31587.1 ErfK/YbiS/YcfS/YnhG family protein [Planktothrix tepida PCC 9214]
MKTPNSFIKPIVFSHFNSFNPFNYTPIFSLKKFQPLGILATGAILTVMVGLTEGNLAIADEEHNLIARNMMELQQSSERWILIDLSRQRLIAWEGNQPVYAVIVSTGKADTPTRTGVFKIYTKYETTRMTGPDYDVPDVPYTMYYDGGMAIHGAYWHNLFGTPVSHGCTNVAVNHAKWLFEWASVGTPVIVHD